MSRLRYLLIFAALLASQAAHAETRLNKDQATSLVMTTPKALSMTAHGGCPMAEYLSEPEANLAMIQLRDMCSSSGTGELGSYIVDLRSCRIWADINRGKEIFSPELQELNDKLCQNGQ